MSPDYECTPQCAQKELDTAGIVRDAWSQHQVQCAILRLLQVSRRRWARSMRISAAFLFLFIVYTKVFPCTCIPPPQAKTVREHAAWYINQPNVVLIFEGKVTKQEVRNGATLLPDNAMSMTGWGRFRVVDFAVKRAFRGTRQDHISVLTGIGGGDCGYDFRTGRTYLVYASMGVGGVWFTNLCSGTNRIEDAGAALRLLSGEKPTSEDLLPPQDYWRQYFEKVIPKRTGSVCGLVLKPDGEPLKGASVELWELRDDGLPSDSATDPNGSTDAGHCCIENAEPGRYLLTAEGDDFHHDARYIAFYPSVNLREEAIELNIEPGVRLPDVKLTTFREPLYTIHIRVVTPDGTQLSYKNGCGVNVDSVYGDPLSYHISGTLEEDSSITFGYIPAGKYVVSTYFEPNFDGGQAKPFPEASRWKPARQEVVVRDDNETLIHMEINKPN